MQILNYIAPNIQYQKYQLLMEEANPYERNSDYYFDSYGHFNIHQEMIKDQIRTKTYMKSMIDNPQLFKDKVVLDLGSGTCILSMFAVKAGARHVYAVEKANVAKFSKKIVEENNMSDRITVFHGMIEEIQLPSKVDIIVSEWMGYFLIYEAMLDSVLWARDHWLNQGGILFPNKATIYLALVQDQKYYKKRMSFWDDVYGLSMKCMKQWVMEEPYIDEIHKKHVISKQSVILELDLQKCKVQDVNFSSEFNLKCTKEMMMNGFIGWFDVKFTHGNEKIISTSPFLRDTHWKQTVFYFQQGIKLKVDDVIRGKIRVRKGKANFRQLSISIQFDFDGKKRVQNYRMT